MGYSNSYMWEDLLFDITDLFVLELLGAFDDHITVVEHVTFRIEVGAVRLVSFTGRLTNGDSRGRSLVVSTTLTLPLLRDPRLGMCHGYLDFVLLFI